MCSGVGTEREMIVLGLIAQVIENCTGLYSSQFSVRVNFDDAVHIFGHIDDNGGITTLSGQTGTTATRKNRRTIVATRRYSLDHILYIPGPDNPNWHLPII